MQNKISDEIMRLQKNGSVAAADKSTIIFLGNFLWGRICNFGPVLMNDTLFSSLKYGLRIPQVIRFVQLLNQNKSFFNVRALCLL